MASLQPADADQSAVVLGQIIPLRSSNLPIAPPPLRSKMASLQPADADQPADQSAVVLGQIIPLRSSNLPIAPPPLRTEMASLQPADADQPADEILPWYFVPINDRFLGIMPLGIIRLRDINQETPYGFFEETVDQFVECSELFYYTDNDENSEIASLIPDNYLPSTEEYLTLLGSSLIRLRGLVKDETPMAFNVFEGLMETVGQNQMTIASLRQQEYLVLTCMEGIVAFLYLRNNCGFTGSVWVFNKWTEDIVEEHVARDLHFLKIRVFHNERGWDEEEEEEEEEGDEKEAVDGSSAAKEGVDSSEDDDSVQQMNKKQRTEEIVGDEEPKLGGDSSGDDDSVQLMNEKQRTEEIADNEEPKVGGDSSAAD